MEGRKGVEGRIKDEAYLSPSLFLSEPCSWDTMDSALGRGQGKYVILCRGWIGWMNGVAGDPFVFRGRKTGLI